MEYYIKTEDWKHIFQILRKRTDIRTGNEMKLLLFIEAIWFMARTGCQWRLLPKEYGSWRAIHRRFKNWSEKGVWSHLFASTKVEADSEYSIIDTTIIRAHACSAGYKKDSQNEEALGRSKGGFTTKVHALVDALGNPLKFILTSGQRHDITKAEALIGDIKDTTVLADKAYDSKALIESITDKKSTAVIPSKRNRKIQREYDSHVYKERHLIECFFGKIKHFRRIFSRFDKMASSFLAFLHFVSVFIWLR